MRWRMQLGRVEFLKKGAPRTDSDAKLKAEFDAHPEDYNGTQLTGRHILISVPPYATPEQKAALKAKAEAIRQELVDGKKTWAEAVQESDYPDRLDGGQLGYFMRHRPIEQEALTAAAFAREVNKIGDLVETTLGYHIVEVTSRTPGKQSFEESKTDVRAWLSGMELREAMKEAREKHPPVGVRPPQHPPAPASAPAVAQSTGSPIHKSTTKPKP
jgi:parvulin-like peptidyl-prolyl isomerase